MKKIVLLDSHAIIHRAYHAMPEFTARDGTPTGGLFGVCSILISTIAELQPDYIIATYDLPGGTFRHEAYDEYKAGRKKTDSELVEQIIKSRDIFAAFGIPIYELAGYEADDMLGTIAEILKQDKDNEIIIASGDHDTMQLIEGTQVKIMTPKKGMSTTMYDEQAVVDRYGFGSDFIPDYKGLAGDPSDNIKGIKGVGAKTATTLITSFGTLQSMYEILHKDESQVLELPGITPRILGLLKDGEEDALFSKELATIKRDVEIEFNLPEQEFKDGLNLATVGELFRQLEFRTMLDRLQKAMGIKSIADEISLSDRLDIENVDTTEALKYKLAVHLLNPTISEPTVDDILQFTSTGEFNDATKEVESEINKLDLGYVWNDIETPLAPLVEQMDSQGFLIDKKLLEKKSKDFHKKIDALEKEIHTLAGQEFNIKSTKQLSVVLFEDMGLPTKGIKKTPKGVLSTKESELAKLKGEHEIIERILEYRELTKLTSTYIDNIVPMIADDGRLYSRFLQNGTVTGRMSSKDPNLQNIPTGGSYGKEIREVFIASPRTKMVSCDYSQVELRAAAMLSGDEKLVEIFNNNEDIHTQVALEMFGEESADNRRKAKVINFGILYGMGANALRKNLGVETTTLVEARAYLDLYFEQFAGLANYLEVTKNSVREKGYSETLYGRKRFFPKINSKVPFIKAMEERMAINAPIQGTATADIIKLAMIDVSNFITEHKLENEVKILAQVHDELVFEIQEDKVGIVGPQIQQVMESVLDVHIPPQEYSKVPLKVGLSVGDNWSELK